jgi:hypothetical protein
MTSLISNSRAEAPHRFPFVVSSEFQPLGVVKVVRCEMSVVECISWSKPKTGARTTSCRAVITRWHIDVRRKRVTDGVRTSHSHKNATRICSPQRFCRRYVHKRCSGGRSDSAGVSTAERESRADAHNCFGQITDHELNAHARGDALDRHRRARRSAGGRTSQDLSREEQPNKWRPGHPPADTARFRASHCLLRCGSGAERSAARSAKIAPQA